MYINMSFIFNIWFNYTNFIKYFEFNQLTYPLLAIKYKFIRYQPV